MSQPFLARGQAVRVRCKACGWIERVAKDQAHQAVLFHRDVTCPKRLAPSDRPHRESYRPAKKAARTAARKRFCPTCREQLARVRDAWACTAGCTNEAARGG